MGREGNEIHEDGRQQTGDGAAQGSGAVTVNDSHLAQTRQRSFIEKLINGINGFISRLADYVQFRLRFLFSRR